MNKKKLVVVIASIMMILTIAIGGTLAYFTAEDTNKNTFTMGNVKIELDEADVNKEGDKFIADPDTRVDGNEYEDIYAGAVLPKDPTVHNTGSYDAYVRVKITLTDGITFLPTVLENDTYSDTMYVDAFKAFVGGFGEGWEVTESTNGMDAVMNGKTDYEITLTYNKAVASKSDTTPVFEKVLIPATWEQDDPRVAVVIENGIEMNIVAQAVQTLGFDTPAAAFAASFDANEAA